MHTGSSVLGVGAVLIDGFMDELEEEVGVGVGAVQQACWSGHQAFAARVVPYPQDS